MKVLNLRCAHEHVFEGWFGSNADYESQLERKLIECPVCGDAQISKLPTAPHLNVSHHAGRPADEKRGGEVTTGPSAQTGAVMPSPEMQGRFIRAVRELIANTEDVGDRFPDEARRMHYGEAPARNIRGEASADEASALQEEGIEVMRLPIPPALKGPLQ